MKRRIFSLLLVLVLALSLLPLSAAAGTLTARYVQNNSGQYSVDMQPDPLTSLSLTSCSGYRLAFYYDGNLVPNSAL